MKQYKKVDLSNLHELPTHPIFNNLPEKLKDSACYAEVETRLRNVMFSDHKHATVKGMVRCKRCRDKLQKRQQMMKEEGFESFQQYLEWKKIMNIIIAKKDFVI